MNRPLGGQDELQNRFPFHCVGPSLLVRLKAGGEQLKRFSVTEARSCFKGGAICSFVGDCLIKKTHPLRLRARRQECSTA